MASCRLRLRTGAKPQAARRVLMLHAKDVAQPDLTFLVEQVLALRERAPAELRLLDRLALRHDHRLALELPFDIVTWVRLGVAAGHNAVVTPRRGLQAAVVLGDGVLLPQGGLGQEHHAGL